MTSYQDERTTRQSIWVGVDGSSASLAAVRWAADEALSRRLPVTLCYASPSASPRDGHAWAALSVARDLSLPAEDWLWHTFRDTPVT